MAAKRKAEPLEKREEEEEEEEEEVEGEEAEEEEEEEEEENDEEEEEEGEEEEVAANEEEEEEEEEGEEEEEEETDNDIRNLLAPFTKEQLREILQEAALKDKKVLESIRKIAEKDVSHRKLFVFGLDPDTRGEHLRPVFDKFGELEDCTVVLDKLTGKCKGYAFITFKKMEDAQKALEEPYKKIGNKNAVCQIASAGPVAATKASFDENKNRKIYVAQVPVELTAEKMHKFFSRYGEIEAGPLGFDPTTGKSRGYALFVYKTREGAKKALEEPVKSLDGYVLQCKWATGSQKQQSQQNPNPNPTTSAAAAVAAPLVTGQNPAFFGAPTAYNPLLAQPYNPALLAPMNPALASSLTPGFAASGQTAVNPGVLGMYGSQPAGALPNLNAYQNPQQFGGTPLSTGRTAQSGTGSFGGVNPYLGR